MAGPAQGVLGWALPEVGLRIVFGVRLYRRVRIHAHMARPRLGVRRLLRKRAVANAEAFCRITPGLAARGFIPGLKGVTERGDVLHAKRRLAARGFALAW